MSFQKTWCIKCCQVVIGKNKLCDYCQTTSCANIECSNIKVSCIYCGKQSSYCEKHDNVICEECVSYKCTFTYCYKIQNVTCKLCHHYLPTCSLHHQDNYHANCYTFSQITDGTCAWCNISFDSEITRFCSLRNCTYISSFTNQECFSSYRTVFCDDCANHVLIYNSAGKEVCLSCIPLKYSMKYYRHLIFPEEFLIDSLVDIVVSYSREPRFPCPSFNFDSS